MPLSKIP